MKRIKRRAASVLVFTLLLAVGLGVFLTRLFQNGADWATYRANASVYDGGMLKCGTLTDRNGLVLAKADDSGRRYAESAEVRVASLHAVGDYTGNIGTGALRIFADELTGYSLAAGTTRGGQTVRLSLDAGLQTAAWKALNGRSGAVLVMDYETGELLCMVSAPSYDPNEEADLTVDGLYLNRCLSAAYTPGSVYKLVTLAAAIENVPDLYERSFVCHQNMDVSGNNIHCTGWHGDQTIEQALANSCNCAFAQLALQLGADKLGAMAEQLGVSGSLPLDGVDTAAGRFDKAEAGSSALAWSGIGQSTDLVSPYAMLRLCAAVAGGGLLREPTLLLGNNAGQTRILAQDTAEKLGDMMNYDVVYGYGRDLFPGLDLCAKSGTAETGDGASHAWFVGYLQSGAPLAFAVVLERGGGGLAQAGTVANTILQKASESYTE